MSWNIPWKMNKFPYSGMPHKINHSNQTITQTSHFSIIFSSHGIYISVIVTKKVLLSSSELFIWIKLFIYWPFPRDKEASKLVLILKTIEVACYIYTLLIDWILFLDWDRKIWIDVDEWATYWKHKLHEPGWFILLVNLLITTFSIYSQSVICLEV